MHASRDQAHDLDHFTLDHDQFHASAIPDLVRDG
jgi:hypothetical protein